MISVQAAVDAALFVGIGLTWGRLRSFENDYRNHTHGRIIPTAKGSPVTGLKFMSDPNPELSAQCKCGHQRRRHARYGSEPCTMPNCPCKTFERIGDYVPEDAKPAKPTYEDYRKEGSTFGGVLPSKPKGYRG